MAREPGRHEKDPKTGKAYNSALPGVKRGPKQWPKGEKLTPSDTDGGVFTSKLKRGK